MTSKSNIEDKKVKKQKRKSKIEKKKVKKQKRKSKIEKKKVKKQKRNWLDLPHDVMANILYRVGVIDILENAQRVCTTWRKICKNPSMWKVLYMENFWGPDGRPPLQDMCEHAVDRSQGQLVDLTIDGFGDGDLLIYLADSSPQLRRLEIRYCYGAVLYGWPESLCRFVQLEELSLYITGILKEGIEVAGRCCPLLKTLKLNLSGNVDDEMALAIGKNLPKLRNLELAGSRMSNIGLQAILDGCRHLESLDLRECFYIDLKGDSGKRCLKQIKYLKLPNDPLDDESRGAIIEPHVHRKQSDDEYSSDDDD